MRAAPILVGLGAAEVLQCQGAGTVLRKAGDTAWLRLPGGVCGVAGQGAAPPGPLWLSGSFPWRGAIDGAAVRVGTAGLDIGGVVLLFEGGRLWRGALPPPDRLESGRDVALDALAGVPPTSVPDPTVAGAARRAARALDQGELAGAARALGGLGPGLTPAGDDLLGGILLAARARRGRRAEPELVAVAAGVRTTELAAGFLHWAARGQHIAPVHALLTAAAVGDGAAARAAVERLCGFGSSSGAAVAAGLRMGLGADQLVTTTSTSETARSVLET